MPTPIRSRPGSPTAPVQPADAFYSTDLREFILPYDAVRQSASPDDTLLEFLQTRTRRRRELAAVGSGRRWNACWSKPV